MMATVKTQPEFQEAALAETVEQSAGISDTMGYVRYNVQAAFEALFGVNLEAQTAAVATLPASWNQPTDVSTQEHSFFNCLWSMFSK